MKIKTKNNFLLIISVLVDFLIFFQIFIESFRPSKRVPFESEKNGGKNDTILKQKPEACKASPSN